MSTLHDRIKFAIEVRKTIAEAATPGPWEYATVRGVTSVGAPGVLPSVAADVHFDADVHHLLANDPTRILRDCERDLKVLERHSHQTATVAGAVTGDGSPHPGVCAWCEPGRRLWPCIAVHDLAEAYDITEEGDA